MRSAITVRWNKALKEIANDAINRNKTMKFMATTWNKLYDPFTPMDTGMLAHDSVNIYVEGGVGFIHHKAPYAQQLYNGVGRRFKATKHRLASAYWDEAAESAGKKEDLIKSVQAYINK